MPVSGEVTVIWLYEQTAKQTKFICFAVFLLYHLPPISLQYKIMEILKKNPKKDLKTGLK